MAGRLHSLPAIIRKPRRVDRHAATFGPRNRRETQFILSTTVLATGTDLTVALERRGLRRRESELVYLNHPPTPWLTEVATPCSLLAVVRFDAVTVAMAPKPQNAAARQHLRQ